MKRARQKFKEMYVKVLEKYPKLKEVMTLNSFNDLEIC